MDQQLDNLRAEAESKLNKAKNLKDLDSFTLEFFGRQNGKLTKILRSLKNLSENKRKTVGLRANQIKIDLWKMIDVKRYQLQNKGKHDFIDLTITGEETGLGHIHPITQTRREMELIFREMGFAIRSTPEVESDYYNFEALNIPKGHAARDMMDSFYITPNFLLRTHISNIQPRMLEKFNPPFSVISSGRVFRREATDARHEHTYHSIEGIMVAEDLSLANLKWVLLNLFQRLFNKDIEIKFRPSYFPFTEPSVEVFISCIFCQKKGCSVCSQSGWIEMLGAGMTHPNVLEKAGLPKGKYTAFAFGIGVTRVAMLKYNVPDARMFAENDQRFLNQF
jgi:phenylalanyl-tRNA synthetase alpha chain